MIRPGDCVRLFAGTKEDRPGVVCVLVDAGNRALVLVGTRTFRPELPHVKIKPKSAARLCVAAVRSNVLLPQRLDRVGKSRVYSSARPDLPAGGFSAFGRTNRYR